MGRIIWAGLIAVVMFVFIAGGLRLALDIFGLFPVAGEDNGVTIVALVTTGILMLKLRP